MMLFTPEEFRDRIRRARELMAQQKIDALLVSQPQNIIYLTGYRTNLFVSNFRPYLAIIPLEGEPTLLMPLLELGVAEELSWIDDIRAWGPDLDTDLTRNMYAPDSLTAAKKVIEEKKLTKARFGIELGMGQ